MATRTRWVWLTKLGEERVLAFCYRDTSAGPSAKGERALLEAGIATWGGPAHPTDELARAMGFRDVDALYHEGTTLIAALSEQRPMTQRQWSAATGAAPPNASTR